MSARGKASKPWPIKVWRITAALALVGCAQEEGNDFTDGVDDFTESVGQSQIGYAVDHWIEIRNAAGEWERTGLIFGYGDDLEECRKAIAGLRAKNAEREYRCVPAQAAQSGR